MNFRHTIRAGLLSACILAVAPVSLAIGQESPYAFALWGDMPYAKAKDEPHIPALIDDMNASDIQFSLYDGDIKDGSSQCTDDIYESAIKMFNSLKMPAVYLPGDNEWTDCHRTNNGGFDNLERLDHVRKVMFKGVDSFGMTTMPVEHHGKPGAKFAENQRIAKPGVMFVLLNVPGSNNNMVGDDDCAKKSARTPEQCAADNAEYAERDAANIEWMKASFAAAKTAYKAKDPNVGNAPWTSACGAKRTLPCPRSSNLSHRCASAT
ncbi:MAG: hypothetical protein ABIQ30_07545 [Devosia sp.]